MKKPKKPKVLSGGARLKAAGYRLVSLGVRPEDHEQLRAAAELERRPLTQFLLFHGLRAAEKILAKRQGVE